VLCWHQVQSSEELEERLRKVKEAGLIPERDERTIKQVKKGGIRLTVVESNETVRSVVVRGKGKPCGGSAPLTPKSPVRVYAPSFAKEGQLRF